MSKRLLHPSVWVRRAFIGLGFVALLLGLIGVILPILPTVPFILLAAFCFARGSERFHQHLLNHRLTGPLIRDWNMHRSIKPSLKRWAYLLTVGSFSFSILIIEIPWLRLMLAVLGMALLLALWRVPARNYEGVRRNP